MFLNSFNHYRAVAIVFIVAGHSYDLAGVVVDTFIERFVANFLQGGAALFVFISGFLFYHIFYKRYTFRGFIKGKLINLLIPYSILPITYYLLHNKRKFRLERLLYTWR